MSAVGFCQSSGLIHCFLQPRLSHDDEARAIIVVKSLVCSRTLKSLFSLIFSALTARLTHAAKQM
jgi:hypothetical protein